MGLKVGRLLITIGVAAFLIMAPTIFYMIKGVISGEDEEELDEKKLMGLLNERMSGYSTGLVEEWSTIKVSSDPVNQTHHRVINAQKGYSIDIPFSWSIDDKDAPSVVHFRRGSFKLSIFKQVMNTSFEKARNYIDYSNLMVREDYGPITHIKDEERMIGSRSFEIVIYEREEIYAIDNDLNHYVQYHYIRSEGTVFSFFLKASASEILNSMETVERSLMTFKEWMVNETKVTSPVPDAAITGISLGGKRSKLEINSGEKVMGLFHKHHDDYWSEVQDLETRLDFEFDLFMDYFNFNINFSEAEEYIYNHYHQGHVMLLTMQPYITLHGEIYDGNLILFDLLNGEYDQFLIEWAEGLKALGEPVFIRFANEMNGDWSQWCSWYYGLDPDLYIMAWTRVHTIFDEVGAVDVHFVWNPHDRTYPGFDWQAPYLYYPGDDMVDWVGLTAYNNGITRSGEYWRDFDECYSDLYDDKMRRYSSKPFMITEFACNEIGGDKAGWIRKGLSSLLDNYPNIWMAVWWNGIDETWIYDIDSSEASLQAFTRTMKDPAVLKDPVKRE